MTAKQLGHLLNPNGNGELGDLVKRARDMGALTEILSGSLPADLTGSVVAANIRDESELALICHSSAWAARLRFEEAALMKLAQQHGVNVDKVSVKVARVDYNKRG
jgi:hypothetical protein